MKQELITFITASLPILELRGAIPLAMVVFKFSALKAYLISVLGNIFLIIPFLFFLNKFSDYLMHRWYWYNRMMNWIFARARRKHLDHFHQWNWTQLALFIFVAIPLPMTGAWSGAVAAYILGLRYRSAILTIFLGILTAGIIVVLLTSLGFLAAETSLFN